jgi:hypothetical protein
MTSIILMKMIKYFLKKDCIPPSLLVETERFLSDAKCAPETRKAFRKVVAYYRADMRKDHMATSALLELHHAS